jgi:hypothetical protein
MKPPPVTTKRIRNGSVSEERSIFRWEMRHLLRLAGFIVEAEFSYFRGSPPAYGKEQWQGADLDRA